jgi:hypothetical protein
MIKPLKLVDWNFNSHKLDTEFLGVLRHSLEDDNYLDVSPHFIFYTLEVENADDQRKRM